MPSVSSEIFLMVSVVSLNTTGTHKLRQAFIFFNNTVASKFLYCVVCMCRVLNPASLFIYWFAPMKNISQLIKHPQFQAKVKTHVIILNYLLSLLCPPLSSMSQRWLFLMELQRRRGSETSWEAKRICFMKSFAVLDIVLDTQEEAEGSS